MIEFSENGKTELLKAFIAAQGEMDGAKKNAANPAFKSKYADLGAVCDAVMEALNKHGLGVIQFPTYDDQGVHVETIICHSAGGTMRDVLSMKPQRTDPQAIGSVTTYCRRYALSAICGVAPEDDDGNAASKMEPAKRQQARQATESAVQGDQAQATNSAQAKREDIWPRIMKAFSEAKTIDGVDGLDARYNWFLDNNKVPRGWKESYDEEYEKRRDQMMEEAARTFDDEEVEAGIAAQ
jgi:hypothetical protein